MRGYTQQPHHSNANRRGSQCSSEVRLTERKPLLGEGSTRLSHLRGPIRAVLSVIPVEAVLPKQKPLGSVTYIKTIAHSSEKSDTEDQQGGSEEENPHTNEPDNLSSRLPYMSMYLCLRSEERALAPLELKL